MYKRVTISRLAVLFISLLILAAAVFLVDMKKGKKTFRTDLFSADTAQVTGIIIYARADQENPVKLEKADAVWMLKNKDRQFKADSGIVSELLRNLDNLRATRVAATDKSKWKEFEVTDSLATKVLVKKGKKTISTLYIGKFSYQMPKNSNPYDYYNRQPKISTYVRVDDEKNVYVADGFLSMVFNRNINDFRNKAIIRSNRSDWKKLTFSYPADSSFVMVKDSVAWSIGGSAVDSAAAEDFLSSLSWLSSEDFVDDMKPVATLPVYTLKIEGDNMVTPIVVKAFPADTTHQFLISSTLNEGVYFSGKKADLTKKIFVNSNKFIK
jgi:hypothetical protein